MCFASYVGIHMRLNNGEYFSLCCLARVSSSIVLIFQLIWTLNVFCIQSFHLFYVLRDPYVGICIFKKLFLRITLHTFCSSFNWAILRVVQICAAHHINAQESQSRKLRASIVKPRWFIWEKISYTFHIQHACCSAGLL